MIIDNRKLTEILSTDLSTRILLSRLPKHEEGRLSISLERMVLLLKCTDKKEMEFLMNNRYAELIANILMYTPLPKSLLNMASKIYTKDEIEHIQVCYSAAQENLKYSWLDEDVALAFDAPEFLIDIFVEIISRFHNQVTEAYKDFQKGVDQIGSDHLFLMATTPSFSSQYAQYWVAEKFGMLNFKKGIIVGSV